ncbi:MAG: UDP-N-acetylmuramate dehydrogenase, partial [Gaiellaceae bacterium]|nr:UDP-N-acetylmuramate dehydrogenase [Gaiellaceae bacterium]
MRETTLPHIEHGVPLARLTTIGTGGPAAAYAAPRTLAELQAALRYAAERGLPVAVVGLGSNVLAADRGVDALVLRLTGELARVEARGTSLHAGGGASNAVCLHAARRASLGGFEFACAIPGTVGGGVRMNAGAYGSDWSEVLVRALVVTAEGAAWRSPQELGLAYRASALAADEVVAAVELRLVRRPEGEIKARLAELQAARKATQPTRARTFGSVFKNPPGELGAGRILDLCGLKGYRVGGAAISEKHANFIENVDRATSADCLALMAEARRRAREELGVELEQEVVFLGDLALERSARCQRAERSGGGTLGAANRVA